MAASERVKANAVPQFDKLSYAIAGFTAAFTKEVSRR